MSASGRALDSGACKGLTFPPMTPAASVNGALKGKSAVALIRLLAAKSKFPPRKEHLWPLGRTSSKFIFQLVELRQGILAQ